MPGPLLIGCWSIEGTEPGISAGCIIGKFELCMAGKPGSVGTWNNKDSFQNLTKHIHTSNQHVVGHVEPEAWKKEEFNREYASIRNKTP